MWWTLLHSNVAYKTSADRQQLIYMCSVCNFLFARKSHSEASYASSLTLVNCVLCFSSYAKYRSLESAACYWCVLMDLLAANFSDDECMIKC